ncbi:hypothetical protein PoB_003728400 [Plakobranchus ocellatus]|uniref:Armadillo-like helical domain-containing protein n=1 Tax=Plakobranchus ocellatus TaxID=259542 RepID=A0AAV4AWL5_9GAST|nr:hypothetical protein PoB_003728400 [Plakobranchus ocellatus]
MGSAKQQASISRVMNILQEWDKGAKSVRRKILVDFIEQNQNKTGPELEQEFAQAASLFLTRLTAWLRLSYMTGNCLSELLQSITIFLSASSGHKFMTEFMEVGGTLTLLEIIDPDSGQVNTPLPVFVQQAAAAKTIGILVRESNKVAEKLVQLRVTHHLMYAMGNTDYADSQRQASITLEHFCRTFPIVDDHVRDAVGETLYDLFMSNPETLYLNMTHVQADVLVSNKVNIPKLVQRVD